MSVQPRQPPDRPVEFLDALRLVAQLIHEVNLQANPELSDAAQQTLLKALERWNQFRGRTEPELLAWLRQILRNHLADLARAGIRRKMNQEQSLDQDSARFRVSLLDDDSTPSHKAMRREHSARVREALNQLPDDQRTAIVLRHMYEFSVEEICPLMGRTGPGVAGLLRRGLNNMRQQLTDDSQRGAHGA